MAREPAIAEVAALRPAGNRAEIEAELSAFLDGYRAALVRGDVETLATAYRLPLPVIRPDRLRVVETPAVLRVELRRILDFYRWCGMKEIAMERLRFDGEERGLWMACLSWRPIDGRGETITSIDVTFAIRLGLGAPRIAAVIAHNEEVRRMPLLHAAAQAMGDGAARPSLLAPAPSGGGETGR